MIHHDNIDVSFTVLDILWRRSWGSYMHVVVKQGSISSSLPQVLVRLSKRQCQHAKRTGYSHFQSTTLNLPSSTLQCSQSRQCCEPSPQSRAIRWTAWTQHRVGRKWQSDRLSSLNSYSESNSHYLHSKILNLRYSPHFKRFDHRCFDQYPAYDLLRYRVRSFKPRCHSSKW
jgi:hypothetical protein